MGLVVRALFEVFLLSWTELSEWIDKAVLLETSRDMTGWLATRRVQTNATYAMQLSQIVELL